MLRMNKVQKLSLVVSPPSSRRPRRFIGFLQAAYLSIKQMHHRTSEDFEVITGAARRLKVTGVSDLGPRGSKAGPDFFQDANQTIHRGLAKIDLQTFYQIFASTSDESKLNSMSKIVLMILFGCLLLDEAFLFFFLNPTAFSNSPNFSTRGDEMLTL